MPVLRALAVAAVGALVVASCSADSKPTASSGAAAQSASDSTGLVDIGQGLQGPSGLHATAVTATGLTHATAMAFDGEGRLWVATADYTDAGQDAVYVVAGVGTAPRAVVTALHTPLGLLWIGDTLYVSSKERVDAYTGFDGSVFASQRTVVTFPAGVGEVNGLALAPDGRIQLGISAPCDHCVPERQLSGAVVSFLPDGTDLRVDATRIRGADRPRLPTWHRRSVRDHEPARRPGRPDPGRLVVDRETGQSWGFPDCYGQGGDACTGVPSPVASLDPHAAVSGVAIVTGQMGTTPAPARWSPSGPRARWSRCRSTTRLSTTRLSTARLST